MALRRRRCTTPTSSLASKERNRPRQGGGTCEYLTITPAARVKERRPGSALLRKQQDLQWFEQAVLLP